MLRAGTNDWRVQLTLLLEAHGGGQIHVEDAVVSVDIEPGATVDVEHDRNAGTWTVWTRAWDRTGGLGSETEVGTVRRVRHAAAIVKDILDEAAYEHEQEPAE